MGLKQSVVIVNEFTFKTQNGGTRGGTPGDYVRRYMARDGATEDLTPVCKDTENFVMRYMTRKDAVDNAQSIAGLKNDMRDIQGDGGIAFGYGEMSLSHSKLKAASKDIQKNFDNGKTVMKTVLSFDENYLRKYGIIDENFKFKRKGDYRGHIDQMKLRMAIMNGMKKLGRFYDDLQYVGVIQVDTKHVHCHLAMVDRGKGHLMPDGTQRGKIDEKAKQAIRRGIDMYLDEAQSVKMMSANVEHDRRNTVCFVKKYTHKIIENRGFSQFMLACLPENRSLWRAGSNRKEMKKANALVRDYVEELLQLPDSGYTEALRKVDVYAKNRVKNEDLTGKEYRVLYQRGQKRIIEESMNCVYSVLKQIPQEELKVRTPLMEVMALPYEDMADEVDSDPMIEFGFKLRSYKSRLDHHKREKHKYHEAVEEYKQREQRGETDESSIPLFEYLKEEEEYNAKLLAKYQHFLRFIPPDEEYLDGFDELIAYDRRITNFKRMLRDTSMKRMNCDNAEVYGRKVYGEEGGRFISTDYEKLEHRLELMTNKFENMRNEYKLKLEDYGMNLSNDNEIQKTPVYEFDDVKALDIHHLLYDFPYDFKISAMNIDAFTQAAEKRYEKFQGAKEYLIKSGQSEALDVFPEADIELQKSTSDKFKNDAIFRTKRDVSLQTRQATKTVALDAAFYIKQEKEIKNVIKTAIADLQYD